MDPEELLANADFVQSLARSLVRDRHQAADIAQDTWMAALRHPPAAGRSLRSWLSTVARNLVANFYRGEKRRRERESAAYDPERVPSSVEIVEKMELRRLLIEAVLKLNDPYRSTIILHFYEGLAPDDIARHDEIPVSTVRTRLRRGLEQLRGKLDVIHGGDRKSWCLALAPLAGLEFSSSAAAAGAAATGASAAAGAAGVSAGASSPLSAVLTGGLVMAAKIKVAGVAIIVLVTAGVVWQLFPGDDPGERDEKAALADSGISSPIESFTGNNIPDNRDSFGEKVPLAPRTFENDDDDDEPYSTIRVDGRFVDIDGLPVAGVRIVQPYLPPEPKTLAVSDQDGGFDFHAPVLNQYWGGNVNLWAKNEGYALHFMISKAEHGNPVHFGVLELKPGGSMSGRVIDDSGSPVSGAEISLTAYGESDEVDNEDRYTGPKMRSTSLKRESWHRRTRTDQDGSFDLEYIEAGRFRVWAGIDGFLYSFTDCVSVRPGEVTSGIDLVLEPMPGKKSISGIVLDPEGAPIPNAQIQVLWWTTKRNQSGQLGSTIFSNDQGRFSYIPREDANFELEVEDKNLKYETVKAGNVKIGMHDVILQFKVPRPIARLLVKDAEGGAVESFRVGFRPVDSYSWERFRDSQDFEAEDLDDDGMARAYAPSEPFSIKVESLGYEDGILGPFDHDRLPERIDVALNRVAGVSGRVTVDDEPVDGARVSLHKAMKPGHFIQINDFLCRSNRPLEIDHLAGLEDLDIVLSQGGAIEGRVICPAGQDPSGMVISFSRGDAYDLSTRTRADGTFRYRQLTPGFWLVEMRDEESGTGGAYSGGYIWKPGNVTPDEWSCFVEEGRTTHFDLDLTVERACVVSGIFLIEGAPPAGWNASYKVSPTGMSFGRTEIDSEGRFKLKMKIQGKYYLYAFRRWEEGYSMYIRDEISPLRGENPWSYDLKTGMLEIAGVPEISRDKEHYKYEWHGPGDLYSSITFNPDLGPIVTLPMVPAGRGLLKSRWWDSESKNWHEEVLGQAEVPANGKAQIKLN